jgi:histidinol-phosphate aminotransferase
MTSSRPSPRENLLTIAPYVGGREEIVGVEAAIKLSANENPLGASPKALAALNNFKRLALYPEGSSAALRKALAAQHQLDADRIVCGNGSDEILHLMAQAYLEPGDEAIMTRFAFLVYRLVTEVAGATPIIVDEPNLIADVDAMLAAVTPRTKIVFLANPNNPTGTMLDRGEIERLHAGLRPDILLVLDGAYAEYVADDLYPAGFDLVDRYENVVATRTFSKIYGLAALRVGWGYCPAPVAEMLNRIRPPFNVNAVAASAAIAALEDTDHVVHSREHNTKWRNWLMQQLAGLDVITIASQANFILLRFASPQQAEAADHFLGQQGLILRAMASYGLADCLRLTVGAEEANRRVITALEQFLRSR